MVVTTMKPSHARLGPALNKGWVLLVIYPNMARYHIRYAYKGKEGRQATTMLSEVEQRERECVYQRNKLMDANQNSSTPHVLMGCKKPSTLSL